ncbi:hypothetical protein DL93DRAFT_1784873 [Clavulina sp. PMI_390]|nr:hypothetical protein DL93DRAFT_1784873 [Clavulina sp. PMI_390]
MFLLSPTVIDHARKSSFLVSCSAYFSILTTATTNHHHEHRYHYRMANYDPISSVLSCGSNMSICVLCMRFFGIDRSSASRHAKLDLLSTVTAILSIALACAFPRPASCRTIAAFVHLKCLGSLLRYPDRSALCGCQCGASSVLRASSLVCALL